MAVCPPEWTTLEKSFIQKLQTEFAVQHAALLANKIKISNADNPHRAGKRWLKRFFDKIAELFAAGRGSVVQADAALLESSSKDHEEIQFFGTNACLIESVNECAIT